MSSCCCSCSCDSTKDVEQSLQTWLKAVSSGTPDAVMKLYANDAVLLPTLAEGVRNTPEKRLDYFKVFTAKPQLQGKIDELHTRVFGDMAINSGLYTFSYSHDGHTESAPARFTFVYKKTQDGWTIVEHHSSLVPAGH